MAATINDRDNIIDGSARTHPVTLPDDVNVSGDVTGTLNGVPVQDVIDAAYTTDGDFTVDILENSGTTVTVNSSTLFEMPGSGSGGTFIGAGGIIGRNAAGDAKVTINSSTGLLTAEDAIISGTIQAGSVIAAGATIAGETASDVVSNADDGYQAYADTISFRTPGAPSNNPVIGSITGSANSVGSLDITLNWTYTQGAVPADHFILYYNQSTTDPTTSSPILAIVDGANRSFRIPGVPVENNYRVGIVAARAWSGGIAKGSIVNSWVRNAGTPILQAALDYSYVTGTKPPATATSNYFTQGSGTPTGGADGDAYWNTSDSTMWFNIGGTWTRGGTINASQITTGTLAAARIASNSITSDKINVSTLSAITANLGTVNAGIITAGVSIAGETASDLVDKADDGYQAYSDTITFRTPGAPSNSPVIGSITGVTSAVGSIDITLNWTYTQGAIPADHFILYYNQSTVDPTTSSPILAIVDGANRSFRIPGVPVDHDYRVGIVAARAWSGGVAKGSIVNSWARNAGTPILQAALDYSYITGTKPDANATSNFFTQGAGNPTGGADGDAYWNTSNSTMWFNIGGTWTRGGTVNASQITTGTLAAARIASNSITSDKINVSTLSAITANLGTVTAGNITGTANLDIAGQARFSGSSSQGGQLYTIVVNPDGSNDVRGIWASSGTGSNRIAILGTAPGSGGTGVTGQAQGSNGAGVTAIATGSATTALAVSGDIVHSAGATQIRQVTINTGGLSVVGNITQQSTGSPSCTFRNVTITSGLSVNSGTASFGAISTSSTSLVTNLNADRLDNYHGASFLRTVACDTGTATVSGSALAFVITLAGIRSRGDGIQMIVENSPSDIRLKTNVDYDQPLGIDYLKKLDTISFNYTDYDTDKRHWGLVAQQVRAALDDFGIDDNQPFHKVGEDGYQSVDLVAHIVPLVKSVQELHDIIEVQNNKIEALENELRGLHKKNSGEA